MSTADEDASCLAWCDTIFGAAGSHPCPTGKQCSAYAMERLDDGAYLTAVAYGVCR